MPDWLRRGSVQTRCWLAVSWCGSAGMPLNWFVAAYVGSAVLLILGLIVEGDRGRPLDSRGLPSAAERG